MKKTYKQAILLCVFVFSVMISFSTLSNVVYGGNCHSGEDEAAKTLEKALNDDRYLNISSVQWAIDMKASSCSSKDLNAGQNVCAFWIGPDNDSTTTVIEVEDYGSIQPDGNGIKWYPARYYGMCTSTYGSNGVTNIKVEPDGLFKSGGSFTRGGWGSPTSLPTSLNLNRFMELATKSEEGDTVVYTYDGVNVGRCHENIAEGAPNIDYDSISCNRDTTTVIVKMKNSYLAESNVSSGNTSSYATTNITSVYKTATANTVKIKKGEPFSVRFSHNVFATAVGKGVDWSVTKEGNGWNYYSGGGGSGRASFSENDKDRDYYIGGPRNGFNGSRSFILRDEVTVTFPNTGTYQFCEIMTVGGKKLTKVCASVVVGEDKIEGLCGYGELGPYTPSDGRTWVLSRAQNERLAGTYSGWKPVIYAMPSDEVMWINCYFPGSMYYASHGVTNVNGEDVAYHDDSHDSCGCTSNGYLTYSQATGFDWNSQAKVNTTSKYGLNDMSLTRVSEWERLLGPFNVGDTTKQEVSNNYLIDYIDDVGYKPGYTDTIFTDTAPIVATWYQTNHSWTQQCCSCNCGCESTECCGGEDCEYTYTCWYPVNCNCTHYYSHCNTYNVGNYSLGTRTETSKVLVPYNFINTTDISVDRSVTYSGEIIGVQGGYVKVGTRYNDATEADYATIVRNAQVRMVAFVSSSNSGSAGIRDTGDLCSLFSAKQCATVVDYSTTLNASGRLEGSRQDMFNGTYNTFDASAGDYMCFAAAVYPATSGEDTNMYESGDGKWYVTAPKCAIIAKKPSMQVTGGSVFTNGSIRTNISSKHNLYNISGYRAMGGSTTSFGSWAEESVIANGLVTNYASGAAIGRSDSGAGYGVSGFNFCGNGVPLSFANYTNNNGLFPDICGSLGANSTGNANISSSFISTNRAALVDYFATGNSSYSGDAYFILGDTWLGENVPSGTGKDIWYYNINGTANIMGGSLGKSMTRVVKAKSVNISQPIIYNATGLRTMGEVPKAVIYSAGDIHISCDVERVDAILIAEGTVYTCNSYTASGGNLNDYSRSINQLVINGAVIANQVELGRTYGNAAGDQSGTAAEVINYDTSSLIWSRSMAGAGESDTLTTVYVRELSPRY